MQNNFHLSSSRCFRQLVRGRNVKVCLVRIETRQRKQRRTTSVFLAEIRQKDKGIRSNNKLRFKSLSRQRGGKVRV